MTFGHPVFVIRARKIKMIVTVEKINCRRESHLVINLAIKVTNRGLLKDQVKTSYFEEVQEGIIEVEEEVKIEAEDFDDSVAISTVRLLGPMMKKENYLVMMNGLIMVASHRRIHGLHYLMIRCVILYRLLHQYLKFK